ncbi:hypothetical protein ACFVS2_16005 [Brevibacillus sp. NPDC058079]|uniref:hypothetical protein n=1 Tax=unclassified Brevibacillus TaxID=2684853 RepID=UPI0002711A73|nr:hypothetical protein [Brevibacillus sp. BC25]EJL26398.1 hypothetical protein PMI05_03317 [Brevibacillus sp. BC25]
MKKVVAIATVLSLLTVNPAFASDKQNTKEETQEENFTPLSTVERVLALEKLDFAEHITPDQIDSLSDAAIYELSKEEGEIVSIQEVYRNLDEEDTGEVKLRTLDKDDFKMSVVAKRINEKRSKDNFKFVATGEWLTDPFYEFTDAIALAWSDDFTLYEDDCYIMRTFGSDRDDVALNDVDPEKGIAYDVDIDSMKNDYEIVLTAKVYKNDDDGSANVVGEYGHVQIHASGIEIGFSGSSTPSVNMNVSYAADIEMASPDYDSFDY